MRLGAKYRLAAFKEGIVLECVYVTDVSKLSSGAIAVAVLKFPGGAEQAIVRSDWHKWVEYVEPRREFFNSYKENVGTKHYGPYLTKESADHNSNSGRYGVLELIHHSDTKVESVFHLTGRK